WSSLSNLGAFRSVEPALALIRMLLVGEGISLETEGAHVPVPGFLFDMNRFFQAVLSRFLRENLVGFAVRDEYRLRGHAGISPPTRPLEAPRADAASRLCSAAGDDGGRAPGCQVHGPLGSPSHQPRRALPVGDLRPLPAAGGH